MGIGAMTARATLHAIIAAALAAQVERKRNA
jgi:hypothetical protein